METVDPEGGPKQEGGFESFEEKKQEKSVTLFSMEE